MHQAIRSARPRRRQNRVQLVGLDGSPVADASTWGAWADEHRYEPIDRIIGTDSMGADVYESGCHEPSDEDRAWLVAMTAQEEVERSRVLSTYQPLPEDLAESAAWSAGLGNGTLPPAAATRSRFGEFNPVRAGQISEDELSMLAAHGCV